MNKEHDPLSLYFEEVVTVEKIISGGYGLGYLSDNKVVMIKNSLPNEVVRVRIKKNKKDFCFGKIIEFIQKSPLRIEPLCPLFGTCGGCQLQMTDYENQLIIKQQSIIETIQRLGKLTPQINTIIPSPKPFHYRNKGSFQVFQKGKIGFCKPGTTIPFEINECFLMEEAINEKIHSFKEPFYRESIQNLKSLNIRNNYNNELINSSKKRDTFIDKVANLSFIVDIDTFFQVNRYIIPLWLEYIKNLSLKYSKRTGLLDLFCGVGIIGQFLSSEFQQVIGIEVNKRLIMNGKKALELNNIHNMSLIEADASIFNQLDINYDTIILNPPRTGLHKTMLEHIIKIKPSVIIYSSCNPDTFARDVQILIQEASYYIDEIQPFDMFPQTHHSEIVTVLYQK